MDTNNKTCLEPVERHQLTLLDVCGRLPGSYRLTVIMRMPSWTGRQVGRQEGRQGSNGLH